MESRLLWQVATNNSATNEKKKKEGSKEDSERAQDTTVICHLCAGMVFSESRSRKKNKKNNTLSRWQGASVSPCKCWHLSIPSLDGLSYGLEQLSPSLCGKNSQFGLKAGAVFWFFFFLCVRVCSFCSFYVLTTAASKLITGRRALPATALCIQSFCGVESFSTLRQRG